MIQKIGIKKLYIIIVNELSSKLVAVITKQELIYIELDYKYNLEFVNEY